MSNTTNDEQSKYRPSCELTDAGKKYVSSLDPAPKAGQRAPLLSDEQIADGRSQWQYEAGGFDAGVRACEDALSTKITSGELMVNRKEEYGETMFIYFATMKPYSPTRSQCSRCNHSWLTADAPRIGGFCMCGAKIVEA